MSVGQLANSMIRAKRMLAHTDNCKSCKVSTTAPPVLCEVALEIAKSLGIEIDIVKLVES